MNITFELLLTDNIVVINKLTIFIMNFHITVYSCYYFDVRIIFAHAINKNNFFNFCFAKIVNKNIPNLVIKETFQVFRAKIRSSYYTIFLELH